MDARAFLLSSSGSPVYICLVDNNVRRVPVFPPPCSDPPNPHPNRPTFFRWTPTPNLLPPPPPFVVKQQVACLSSVHTNEVTALSIQATGNYFASASKYARTQSSKAERGKREREERGREGEKGGGGKSDPTHPCGSGMEGGANRGGHGERACTALPRPRPPNHLNTTVPTTTTPPHTTTHLPRQRPPQPGTRHGRSATSPLARRWRTWRTPRSAAASRPWPSTPTACCSVRIYICC
jgi:hypothetical protein